MDRSREDLEALIAEVSQGSGVKESKVRSWFQNGAQFGGLSWRELASVDEVTLPKDEARILFYLKMKQQQ